MATLIQSKQIEGIVTASIVEGTFQVSGSQIITGSQELSGDITASNIRVTGNYYGDGSQLTFGGTGIVSGSSQITYDNITGIPAFIGGDNITITSGSGGITITSTGTPTPEGTVSSSAQITALGFVSESTDAQTLSLNQVTRILSISNGNSVDLTPVVGGASDISGSIWSTGSNWYYVSADLKVTGSFHATSLTGSIDYSNLTNVPTLVSGSSQITAFGFVSESTDISSLNSYTSSTDGRLTNIEAATGSYLTSSGSVDFTDITSVPSGLVSGSIQVLGGTDIVSSSAQITALGFVSESGDSTPAGTISGSAQITALGFISSSHTDITSLNTFTSSIQTEVDTLSAATSSYLTSSGSVDYTDLTSVPSGIVSGSSQITSLGFISESTTIPAGTISGSAQITSLGFISSSHTDITSLNSFTQSADQRLDSLEGASGSYLTSSGSVSYDDITGKPTLISQSEQVNYNELLNKPAFIGGTNVTITSASNGITINSTGGGSGSGDITHLNAFTQSANTRFTQLSADTASQAQRLDSLESESGSYLTSLDSGIVSSSAQITALGFVSESGDSTPAGTISGSAQITALGFVSESVDLTSLNSYTSSTDDRIDNIEAATGSYLTSLDSGIISGSSQITALGFVSESSDLTSLNSFTSSIQTEVDGLSSQTSSYLTSSGSVDYTDITSVPSGIVSSSAQITSLGFVSESGADLTSLNTFTASNANTSLNSYTSSLNAGVRFFNIENTTESLDSRLDSIEAATSSYLTSSGSVDFTDITSVPSGIVSSSEQLPDGLVSGSSQITALGFISESAALPAGVVSGSSQLTSSYDVRYQLSGSSIPFNGNRIVSQEKLPTMFTSSFNPGTSGSVIDFLNAIFYPNTEPSITSGNQTIAEFSASGASIFTIEATDPEGQSLTFGTSSTYTDDLVRVSSAGVVTLNATATSASFNTDLVGGSHGHTFVARVEDTFGAEVTKDITIFVTPNAAPQFRETSVVGNVITNVSSNLNENSANGTLVKRVFFTDAEGDTITIDSSSISPAGGSTHFTITKYSTYVDIEQNTGSLDYETYPVYTFSLSASDEHYQNSDDSDSIVTLPVSISVVDNVHPTINNQTLSSINENSSNGATVGTISATDSEGDAITFSQFTLYKLELDNVDVSSGSYGGTSQATDPHENPFNMDSSGNVTRKNGVFLNSDLINEYQYTVRVRDSFNTASNEAIVTIPIDDDTPATLTDNWSAGPYIKESQNSGSTIRTTDYGSTVADYNSNQSGTFSSSNPAIAIASNGNLSLAVDLSGSVTQSGDTISSTITFTNTFGTTTTDALVVNVVDNDAPAISFTNQTANFNTNLGTSGTTMVSMSVSDTEGDTPFSASLSGSDLELVYSNADSSSIGLHLTTDATAREYFYSVTITDQFGSSRTYSDRSFTVSQADIGTLGGDTTSYIIESAVSGALIRESSNGRTGNQAQLTVSYSPSYGSPSVASFTSSLDETIAINSSGQLSLLVDLSGSATSSGDTITPTITFQDQYGNLGSGSITINVAANQAPNATFTDHAANFETDFATSGSTMVSMSISDDESDTPFSASISGSDLELVYSSADSSSVGIHATSDLTARTHTYSVTVFDQFGKSRTYTDRTFTVAQSADYGKVYIYRSSYGSDAGLSSNYNALMGASTLTSDVPPEVTAYTANNTSPYRLISSSLGESTLALAGGEQADLVATLSGSDLDTIISESNPLTMGNSAEQYIIIAPSGSDMIGIPTSMTDGFGDNTAGRYVMAVKADGGSWGQEGSTIHLLDTSGSVNGYDKHFVIGRTGHNSAASVELRIIEASGSLPS